MIETQDSLDEIFQNLIQGSPLDKTSFLFFQTLQPAELFQQLYKNISLSTLELKACHLEEESHAAYHPILPWIVQDIGQRNGREIDGIFKDADIYQFHKPLLKQYLLKKDLQQDEEIIPGELDFERKKLWDDLIRLLVRTGRGSPRVFLIGNAHLLPFSTILLLKELFQNRPAEPMLFIFVYSLENPLRDPEDREHWDSLVQLGEEEGIIFAREQEEPRDFSPSVGLSATSNDFENANVTLKLLALEDSRHLWQKLHSLTTEGKLRLKDPEMAQMWESLGLIHYLHKDFDLALGFLQSLLALAHKLSDKALVCRTQRRMGQVYLEKGELEEAARVSGQSLKLAQELRDPLLIFYPRFTLFIIEDRLRLQNIREYRAFLENLLKEAESLGFLNTFAFIATNPFGLYSDFSPMDQEVVEKGLQIAQKAGNYLRMASAYQTMGLAYSVKGHYAKVLDMYQKSRRLKEKLQDNLELAFIQNGMGFYYSMTSFYKKAHDFYCQAMQYLKEGKDFHEVAMTLFNLAINSLLAQRPDIALDAIKKCLRLMRILERKNLSYHSELGILVLMGIALIKQKYNAQAWQIWMKIQVDRLEPYPEKNEEFFLLNLFQALLREGKLDESQEKTFFDNAEKYLFRSNDNIQYWAPFFYWEKGQLLLRAKKNIQAGVELSKGLKAAQEQDNLFYSNIIQSQLAGKPPILASPLEKAEIVDIEAVISSARLSKNLASLQQRIEDIHFLNTLQSLFYEEDRRESLITKTMDMFYASLEFQDLFFHRWEGGRAIKEYGRQNREASFKPDFQRLLELLFVEGEKRFYLQIPHLVLDFYPDFTDRPFISLFFPWGPQTSGHILAFLAPGALPMKPEKIQVLSFSSRLLGQALEKIDQNLTIRRQNDELKEKNILLEKTASTDPLTGLGNRKALFLALKKEAARVSRYFAEGRPPLSLLYLDLDNFKFFYESFGHGAWDVLLSRTSHSIQEIIRSTDHIFHFGRDEFIILLPETDAEGAVGLAKRIVDKIEESGSYRFELEKNLGQKLSIPSEKALTCCIGISVLRPGKDRDFNPDLLLQQASLALAQARDKGKGQIQLYEG